MEIRFAIGRVLARLHPGRRHGARRLRHPARRRPGELAHDRRAGSSGPPCSAPMPRSSSSSQGGGPRERPAPRTELPLDVRGTAFQQRVWQALRDISPGGTTASYAQIACAIGAPRRSGPWRRRARPTRYGRGQIPCHRVVRTMAACRAIAGVSSASALLDRRGGRLSARRGRRPDREPRGRAVAADWARVAGPRRRAAP